MRKRQMLHEVTDITCLCYGRFQEFPSGGRIEEYIADQERAPVRSSDLFKFLLLTAFDAISYPGQRACCLCDQFDLAHSADA